MRKNGLISIVILLLCVTPILAQCGGGDEPEPTATSAPPPTATTVPPTPTTEAAAEEPTEAPAEEPEAEATEAPAEEPEVEATEAPAEEPADDDSSEQASDEADTDEQPTDRSAEAYPAPAAEAASDGEGAEEGAYPAPSLQAAAAPAVEEYPTPVPCPATVFDINEPLTDGDEVISGSGVEGVGINIVSITMMGESLGETEIGDDGTWSIDLDSPLVEDHGLGIRLVSTPPEFEDQDAFINSHIWPCGGDHLKDYPIPAIGLLLDSAQVVGK